MVCFGSLSVTRSRQSKPLRYVTAPVVTEKVQVTGAAIGPAAFRRGPPAYAD